MKKILLALLLVLTLGFTLLMTNSVSADEDLIDLYPQNNPDFAETYGNSHWTVDFNGHRWHMVKRSTRHVSNFTGFDPDAAAGTVQEFVGSDVPAVFYPSGSGSLIINDTEFDALVTSPGKTRVEITATVNNRFWAYFDENGKLYMYEDEFVNPEYITKVEDEDYWRLSTEAEITQFNDAEEGEKPENIRHTPIRIKTTEDGYKAEPLALTWATSHNPADPQESVIVDHESSAVLIPAGHWCLFGPESVSQPWCLVQSGESLSG